jgi:hypothetical protein
LILEDDRMVLPFGLRSSGKMHVNESCWIQTMMDCLLAIGDGMISVNVAK